MPKTATIADVARVAGVSRAAVSKVIRNAYGVSDEMRERVQSAISELDYRPRVSARGMRGGTFTLGIALPSIANRFFAMLINGATGALKGSPYQLIIAITSRDPADRTESVQSLIDRQVDGLIAVLPSLAPEWLETRATQVPIVLLGRHDDSLNYDTVNGDDIQGAKLATRHLIGLGHRRITHLTIDEHTGGYPGTPHELRTIGFREAMLQAGLAPDVHFVAPDEDLNEVATALLTRYAPPTAIFAGHDELALPALAANAELDRRTAIVGYDDTSIASHPLISLTSVNQSGTELGATAVRLLLERIDGRKEAIHHVIQPSLSIRSSTNPAPDIQRGSNQTVATFVDRTSKEV